MENLLSIEAEKGARFHVLLEGVKLIITTLGFEQRLSCLLSAS